MPIYTRTGDTGKTSLFGGKRISKSDPRIDLIGTIDELNSWVGLLSAKKKEPFFNKVQTDLFTIGSTLAGWKGDLSGTQERIDEMEARMDRMDKSLPRLNNFILPGGSVPGSYMHIARNICRRAERLAVRIKADPSIIKYLNRLSDLFFILARFINKKEKVAEVTWSGIPRRKFNKQK